MESIIGKKLNELTVISKAGGTEYNCRCSCGREKKVKRYNLVNGITKSCGHLNRSLKDLVGNTFGDITVIESLGRGRYKVLCKCGEYKTVSGGDIRRGKAIKCTHNKENERQEMIGKTFGDLTVIDYEGDIMKCRCSCGNIVDIYKCLLITEGRKSCGCRKYKQMKTLIGQEFGILTVIGIGEDGNDMLCRCSCGTLKYIRASNLRNGSTTSCGCSTEKLMSIAKDSLYNRERTEEQIDAVKSREKLEEFIKNNFDTTPSIAEINTKIGTQSARYYIDKYNLSELVDKTGFSSKYELEILDIIYGISSELVVERHNYSILHGRELDIYIPSIKLAIEFNGDYWHNELQKDKNYHQNKTIACARQGIRLIHIFEYEWLAKKEKIVNIIKLAINGGKSKVFARNTIVSEIDTEEARDFINMYHLDGYTGAEIKIGLFNKEELLGIMTFGKPRFNREFEYELIRLVWKDNTVVVGGKEKIFKYFITKYAPLNIVSYCNIAKFTGKSYMQLGFTCNNKSITKPGYVWLNTSTKEVLSRYQTQKKKLIKLKYGSENETEADIMYRLGFIKTYDCGNLRLTWEKK